MPVLDRLAIFILSCWGVTNVVAGSKLIRPIRDRLKPVPFLGDMLPCYMCAGWWVGAGLSAIGLGPGDLPNYVFTIIRDGFISSGTCWIIHVVLTKLGSDQL